MSNSKGVNKCLTALADAGFKERGGVVGEGDHQKGEGAGG